jgi:hypothetical protein
LIVNNSALGTLKNFLLFHSRRRPGAALSPFEIASDFDVALVLNGSVSLRRSTEIKGRSITFSMPTIFRTVRLFGYAVFLTPPFEDICWYPPEVDTSFHRRHRIRRNRQ